MGLEYFFYEHYFKNKVYIYSAAFQIILCLVGIYLIWVHKPELILYEHIVEYIIFGVMLIDVLIFNIVNRFQFSILNLLEWIFVFLFIGEVIFNAVYTKVDKEYQILLTATRIVFLSIRLLIGVARMHQVHKDHEARAPLDLDSKSQNSKAHPEAKEIPSDGYL